MSAMQAQTTIDPIAVAASEGHSLSDEIWPCLDKAERNIARQEIEHLVAVHAYFSKQNPHSTRQHGVAKHITETTMRITSKLISGVAVAMISLLAFVGSAGATSFNLNFTANDGTGVSLNATIDATLQVGGTYDGDYLITAISGTLNSGSLTGLGSANTNYTFNQLITGGPSNFQTPHDWFVADNVYYPGGGTGNLLDGSGIAFFVACSVGACPGDSGGPANTDQVALWGNPGGGPGSPDTLDIYFNGFVSGVTSISETPLPAALPLFSGGLGVMGLLLRGKKRKNAKS